LKKNVISELQRGFSTGMVYADIARNISNWGTADLNRSKRIARTEGHRVQCKADLNCAYRARQMGCVPLSNGMQSLMAKQENRIGL